MDERTWKSVMRTNKELQRENERLRLRLKKCMVWRGEVRRLNKTVRYYLLAYKEEQRLRKTMAFRPPWAPDMDVVKSDCDLIIPTDEGLRQLDNMS